jgi:hypothetical protein
MNPSPPDSLPEAPATIAVPGEMLLTLLNGLDFARQQGAFNTVSLAQLYALTGVQLYVANLVKPSDPPPNA